MNGRIAHARRWIRKENRNYSSTLRQIPQAEWPAGVMGLNLRPTNVWRSSGFLVQEFLFPGDVSTCRLSIVRADLTNEGEWASDISWDELMRLKSECGYANRWAVEVFPDADSVVNVTNMRHLWVLREKPTFAW